MIYQMHIVDNDAQWERRVGGLLLTMGMTMHLKGFLYMEKAVLLCIEDMKRLSSVTKLLYPDVGKAFHISGKKVERAIRNAIESAWEYGNENMQEEIFGYSRSDGKKRPTNSEYIAGIATKLLFDDAK